MFSTCSLYRPLALVAALGLASTPAFGQAGAASSDALHVTVSVNEDGSRTSYEINGADHTANATTTGSDGKILTKVRYTLDEANRFATGEVTGPKGEFRMKTRYTYDAAGRLLNETQSAKDDSVLHKIVYSYNDAGKQIGYSVYDGAGHLISQVGGARPTIKITPRNSSGH